MVEISEDDYLAHYGIKRKSGRYPWGSGGDELSRATGFQQSLEALRAKGMKDTDIAAGFGMTTSELRNTISIAGGVKKQADINQAETLAKSGMGNSAISQEMFGTRSKESTVRGLLEPSAGRKAQQLADISDTLRKRVDQDNFIDVGKGVEHHLQISKTKLDTALALLKSEGYAVETVLQPAATTAHDTRVRVLAAPGNDWASISRNLNNIRPIQAFSNDQGHTFQLAKEPLHLNPARLDIKYGDQGGKAADGVIYIRPGVKDLSMDGASYAQVRIQVGKGHYIKGMAVMKEGLPAGVDVQFNTSKSNTGNKLDALKPVKADSEPMERFGAIFSQITDKTSGKVTSHLNIVNDEADWDKWSKNLATQLLSKQKPDFVKRQLDVTLAQKKSQLDEIMSLTNPVVKKELLKSYADDMDASSVHLKAAALPRQKTHVLIPVNSLKDHEVYAPGYKDGERVVLVRFPHGGKFEIPDLVVNNRNREARSILNPATTKAAIGINAEVAKRLSGADFDGDTVVLIPNTRGRIQSETPLQGLKNFDPQESYRGLDSKGNALPGVKLMKNTQGEMGSISNLITDMTIAGATHEELARAVRHSMVVIDAEKHGLDYTRSAKENSISALKKKYQPGVNSGGSTIISRTKGEQRIPDFRVARKDEGGAINPKTGEVNYVPTGKTKPKRVIDKVTGQVTYVSQPKLTKVARGSRLPGTTVRDAVTGEVRPVKDAHDLVGRSGNPVERHYADYSNRVKELANRARLEESHIKDPQVNHSAKAVYKTEIESLRAKVKLAALNSPRERQAQQVASVIIKMKREANPNMDKEDLKRTKVQALRTARESVGAKPQRVTITDREWEAIQSHAVAASVLREILSKADTKRVKELAQPKTELKLPTGRIALARSLLNSGYTRAEVADQLGVSLSTLDRSIKGTETQ